MSTLRVNTLQNAAGTGQPAMSGAAKAWVNFNGTSTVAIRAAFNVTSITDNGTGDYTVNFTSALPDANYAVNATADVGGVSDFAIACTGDNATARTASLVRIRVGASSGAGADSSVVSISVFD